MDSLSCLIPSLSRVLIGFYFLFFGLWNIYHWTPILQTMIQRKIPLAILTLQTGIFCQIVAGGMIMVGMFVPLAAGVLIPFTIIAIFIFHPFWQHRGESLRLNFSIFIANLTVAVGALLRLMTSS